MKQSRGTMAQIVFMGGRDNRPAMTGFASKKAVIAGPLSRRPINTASEMERGEQGEAIAVRTMVCTVFMGGRDNRPAMTGLIGIGAV